MNANNRLGEVLQAAMELDLEPIKRKLMHRASGEGWSIEKANAVEKEYRRFLCLMKMYPDEATAPLVDVDTFWHYHILDTMKYAADCEQVFGYFLHHYPYVGMGDEDDAQFRLDSGDRMRTLYEATFGEPYAGVEAPAFCAGPIGKNADRAGPGTDVAFCAGPIGKEAAPAGRAMDVAFCAGPIGKEAAPAARPMDVAFCAGPIGKEAAPVHRSMDIAFCAGPIGKNAGHADAAEFRQQGH